MYSVIDLFSGCGGFSSGFYKNGYDIVAAVEFDKQIANSYAKNHQNTKVFNDDIKNIDEQGLLDDFKADIIIGGLPCQGFSMAGARIRKNFIDDPRNYLFKYYVNIVKKIQPRIFLMENVKGILSMEKGEIFKEIKNSFEKLGYFINYKILKASDFGIPQTRERVVIIGSKISYDLDEVFEKAKENIKRENPNFFNKISVWDAIFDLDEPSDTGVVKSKKDSNSYLDFIGKKFENIQNHITTAHSVKAKERMSKINNGENYKILDEKIKSIHSGSYGRLEFDKPSPTITTRFDTPAGGRFIHPIENRTITPREGARIQSFSDDFIFYGSKTSICKQIGNAVPPKLAYFLSEVVKIILNQR